MQFLHKEPKGVEYLNSLEAGYFCDNILITTCSLSNLCTVCIEEAFLQDFLEILKEFHENLKEMMS